MEISSFSTFIENQNKKEDIFQEELYSPENIRIIKNNLYRSIISPDSSLISAITNAKTNKSLLPIGICLRFANPNMYIKYPSVSENIHLLGYTYLTVPESIRNSIIALLIVAGSDLSKSIFDEKRGGIRSEKDIINSDSISVDKWLYSRGYTLAREYREKGLTLIPEANLKIFKVLVDQPGNIYNELLIKSLGNNVAKAFQPEDKVSLWNSIDLVSSIKYYNVDTYRKTENAGYTITYPLMNDLIRKAISNRNNDVLLSDLIEMIKISISNGYELDKHQLILLSSLDEKLVESIREKYSMPLWKKSCQNKHIRQNSDDLPVSVKRNIIGANIELRSGICDYLEDIDKTNITELISATQAHKASKLIADTSLPKDYIGETPNSIKFTNSNLLRSPPVNYGDMYEVHYTDSRDHRWIFTADMFENLLETRVNPVNLEPLPNNTLENINFRMKILSQLGINTQNVPTISESLSKLRENDDISDNTEEYLHILQNKGIYIKMEKLNKVDLNKLSKVNIDVDLNNLTNKHISVTLLWILVWLSKVKPDLLKFVVQELNLE